MPHIPVRNAGSLGLVKDVPGYELPPEAWTGAGNVEFLDGKVVRMFGENIIEGTPPIVPVFVFPAPTTEQAFWVYTDTQQVYLVAAGEHTEITRASGVYTGSIDDPWTGAWLGGVLVLNNGVNDPQQLNPISRGSNLAVLANWPANTKARVLRGFGNFLMAIDFTRDSVRYPTTIKWSHPADPGAVPVSWDHTDPTRLAGELPLNDTPGALVDGLTIGRSMMLYKEDAIVRLDRIQSNQIFYPTWISIHTGLMGVNCVANFKPGQQVFLTHEADVIVTDGQQAQSVTDKRIRAYLEQRISGDHRTRCFLVANYPRRSVMVCYPTGTSEYCNEAAVWNWNDNTWSIRQLSPTLSIASGLYDENALPDSWELQDTTWDTWTGSWGSRLYVANKQRLIGGFVEDGSLREVSAGPDLAGTGYSSFVERTGLSIVGQDRHGNLKVDPTVNKLVKSIRPIVNSRQGALLKVSVGASDGPNTAIAWEGPYDFDPEADEKVDCYTEGRYLALRVESEGPEHWELTGYMAEIENLGTDF